MQDAATLPITPRKIKREELPAGKVLCEYCTAKCCRYFALPLDEPDSRNEFDDLRWFMMHGRVSAFVENETWYLMIHADCQHLRHDNLCNVYDTRPRICRAYKTVNCEYDDDTCYEKLFETPEQIEEYADAIFPPRKRKRGAHPTLPILSMG